MLNVISINNVKTLRDIAIQLGPMTILAGPNGCGKTTALRMIELLSEVVRVPPMDALRGERSPAVLRTHGSSNSIVLGGVFANKGQDARLTLCVSDAPSELEENVRWVFELESDLKQSKSKRKQAGSARQNYPAIDRFAPESQYLHFAVDRLIAPSFAKYPDDRLNADGSNLPSVLATVFATDPERRDDIHDTLRTIVPTIKSVRPELAIRTFEREYWEGPGIDLYQKAREEERGFQLRFELESGAVVPAYAVSEGTVLTLGLLTLLLSPKRPNLVLIDNLERGLHPRALKTLVEQLRAMQARFPLLQIVATTHSPYLLDCFEPSEIRLMCLDESGHTICGGIQDHPDFGRWKDEMLPGEFWSMVGEDWLLDKAAAVEPQKP